MLTRLQFLSTAFGAFFSSKLKKVKEKYEIPLQFWYEDEEGRILKPIGDELDPPKGARYQWNRFASEIRESCYDLQTRKMLMEGNCGWDEEVVLKMVTSGNYKLSEAILIQ